MAHRIVQTQTRGGVFNSTATFAEAVLFSRLSYAEREDYLQRIFYNNGHGEGADNLLLLTDAIEDHGMENVISTTHAI